ncbi:hypothetical protein SAMN05192558_10145 [Actinokineospora alba]|uniref:Uncharacterized protein n=1 Tax=Actinokineospora alba TaxID=504798 RepID=A0A1H0EPK8_9PSEU|nr:hypothetical protein [Actinokineospora alba]TDP69169.1 hypothetical protein C8E96_4742 [Actinokineospora alba]SDI22842.1 hypothetical protein SAMN05421871_103824 [Actinokineospora alba]SDN84291.1 hypothetical protein SAMN05192558_10145 [Actinokineospora alba]
MPDPMPYPRPDGQVADPADPAGGVSIPSPRDEEELEPTIVLGRE